MLSLASVASASKRANANMNIAGLHCHCGNINACCSPGMVPMACRVSILSLQGVSESGALECSGIGIDNGSSIHGVQVWSSLPFSWPTIWLFHSDFETRAIFLPVLIVTLPLPPQITSLWPKDMVIFLQWFAFWSFSALLTIPWLFCVYQLVTKQLGRTRRLKQVLDDVSAPKVVIVMPCYNEEPDVLIAAIDSVVDCDYPPGCIHVFLSFDGDAENELFLTAIEKLGVPLTLQSYPKSIDVTYKSARITVSRFPHGGKRHCQKCTFKLIDKVYEDYLRKNDNLFILFIDSDCILDPTCLQNFVYDMELSPGNTRDMLAMTGIITSTTKKHSLITLLQDMEYIHGQLFERTVESGCGSVTCLPGALTMLRFSAFRRMAKYYFADKAEKCEDLFDFAKCHLGEDRWLTHLFMIGAKRKYQIQMCTSAFCKTEAVQTLKSLIKQRRRWFLGFITNEVCMLTDWRLWNRYPILIFVRFMQNTIRTTALLFFVMVLALCTTAFRADQLPIGFIAISLGLNWLMMIYFGAKLKRFKIWLYPMMFILNPFFNWYYMVYGIFTAGQRTWGGPRADAASADSNTTPQQAIEQAEQQGDVLNVVPETFMPAAAARDEKLGVRHARRKSMLMPPSNVEGKFSAPERKTHGWYLHPDDSLLSVGAPIPAFAISSRVPVHPRDSFDSTFSVQTAGNSIHLPQRVESFMGEEDRRKYEMAQALQYNTWNGNHGIYPQGQVYDFEAEDMQGKGWTDTTAGQHSSPSSGHNAGAGGSSNGNNSHRRVVSTDSDSSENTHREYMRAGSSSSRTDPSTSSGLAPQAVYGAKARSPLSRASLVRTGAAAEELGYELEETDRRGCTAKRQ